MMSISRTSTAQDLLHWLAFCQFVD